MCLKNSAILPFLIVSAILSILYFSSSAFADPFSDKEAVKIILNQPDAIRDLVETGINIGDVNGCSVTAYVDTGEQEMLRALGYLFTPALSPKPLLKKGAEISGHTYPTYAEITEELTHPTTGLAARYPDICIVESAGKSVQGNDLWWVRISDNPGVEEPEPEVHYISTLHGDEPVGTVLCLELIRYLLDNYNTDAGIKALIDSTEIWIMPLMNPDGYADGDPYNNSRHNADGDDLNRSFPDPSGDTKETFTLTTGRPDEVARIMDWALETTPVMGASFHTGALVVNYPFDYTYDASPDDSLFEAISLTYSEQNIPLFNSSDPSSAENGIVRGSDWYKIAGGLQDWIYLGVGGNHVTIELSSIKQPDESELDTLWEENREAMIAYLQTVHTSVQGVITDKSTGDPLSAWVRIEGIDHAIYTDPDKGDYCRMLVPGDYRLIARAEGYQPYTGAITITEGVPTFLNIELETGEDPSGDDGVNWPAESNSTGNSGGGGNGSSGGGSVSDPLPVSEAGSDSGGCFISDLSAGIQRGNP